MKTRFFETLLGLIAIFAALLLSETFLEFTLPSGRSQSFDFKILKRKHAKDLGLPFDERTDAEVVRDLRSQGVTIYPYLAPRYYLGHPLGENRVFPLGAPSGKKLAYCNEGTGQLIFNTDEEGFNNPSGTWASPVLDIGAIGDSFTFGACVASGKGFVDILRSNYPKTLNLGMSANGPLMMLAGVQEYFREVRPRSVIWFFFENDLEDLADESLHSELTNYLDPAYSQKLLQHASDRDAEMLRRADEYNAKTLQNLAAPESTERHSASIELSTHAVRIFTLSNMRRIAGQILKVQIKNYCQYDDPRSLNARNLELFKQILAEAKQTVEGYGGTFRFVYLPACERFRSPFRNLPFADRPRLPKAILSAADQLGISTLDLIPEFEKEKDPLRLYSFCPGGHFSEEGHRLVAQKVGEWIKLKTTNK